MSVELRAINCHMTSLVRTCLTFWEEYYQSDIAVLEL